VLYISKLVSCALLCERPHICLYGVEIALICSFTWFLSVTRKYMLGPYIKTSWLLDCKVSNFNSHPSVQCYTTYVHDKVSSTSEHSLHVAPLWCYKTAYIVHFNVGIILSRLSLETLRKEVRWNGSVLL
jgi:hypothetical protein